MAVWLGPVSYTHLDVYKRQVQRHQAIQRGTIFARKSHFDGTIQQLRNTLSSSPQIVRSLYYWCVKKEDRNLTGFNEGVNLNWGGGGLVIEQCDNLPTGFFYFKCS